LGTKETAEKDIVSYSYSKERCLHENQARCNHPISRVMNPEKENNNLNQTINKEEL